MYPLPPHCPYCPTDPPVLPPLVVVGAAAVVDVFVTRVVGGVVVFGVVVGAAVVGAALDAGGLLPPPAEPPAQLMAFGPGAL